MKKSIREQVRLKFNGLCAYTGQPLGDDWQVDHVHPQHRRANDKNEIIDHNHIDNLVPTIRIINHYKRGLDLEGFRDRIKNFHIRLAKLPKKTLVPETKKRIIYMNTVANHFAITIDKGHNGTFYFETL
jgi:5-methylcytosine-specific restriction endonuclease McrA